MAKVRVQVLLEPEVYIFLETLRIESKTDNITKTINQLVKNYKNLLIQMKEVKEKEKKENNIDKLEDKYGLDGFKWKE